MVILRAVVLAALTLASGCKDRPDEGPMPMPTRAPPPGFDVDTARRYLPDASGPREPDALSADDLEAVAALAPALGRIVTPLTSVPNTRIARMAICVAAETPSKAARALREALETKGWKELDTIESTRDTSRAVVTATREERRVTATVQTGTEDCHPGEVRASVSFQELGERGLRLPARTEALRPGGSDH